MIRLRKPLFPGPLTLRHTPGKARLSALGQDIEDESEEDDEEHADIKHEAVVGIIDVCANDAYDDQECEVSAFLMKETFNDEMLNHAISVYEAAVSEIQTHPENLIDKVPISLLDLEKIQEGGDYQKFKPEDLVILDQKDWTPRPPKPVEPEEPEEEEEEEPEEPEKESELDDAGRERDWREVLPDLGERDPRGRFTEDDAHPERKKRKEDNLKDQVMVGYKKRLKTTGDPVSELQQALVNLHDEIQNLDGEKAIGFANDMLTMVWGEEQGEHIEVDRAYLYP